MMIVLDSTALVSSNGLQSRYEQRLFALRGSGHTVVVPEVVIAELNGQYLRALNRTAALLEEQKRHFAFADDSIRPQGNNLATAENLQRHNLLVRHAIQSRRGVIQTTPDTPHDELVRWAVERHPPFREDGSGYRDALIWKTVKGLAANGPVAFVTDNVSDFGKGKLRKELQKDLTESGIPLDRVRLYRTARDVLYDLVEWVDEAKLEIEGLLQTDSVGPVIRAETKGDLLSGRFAGFLRAAFIVTAAELADAIVVTRAWRSDENRLEVELEVDAEVEFGLSQSYIDAIERVEAGVPREVAMYEHLRDLSEAAGGTHSTCVYVNLSLPLPWDASQGLQHGARETYLVVPEHLQ